MLLSKTEQGLRFFIIWFNSGNDADVLEFLDIYTTEEIVQYGNSEPSNNEETAFNNWLKDNIEIKQA